MATELLPSSVLVSATGGTLDYIDGFGELAFSVAVPPGRFSAREFLDLVPAGGSVQIADGLVAVQRRGGYGVQAYGEGSHMSGANPDFRPTSADRMAREMRLLLSKVQAKTDRLDARLRKLDEIERIPRAPDPAPVAAPVIEPAPAPSPVIEPAPAPSPVIEPAPAPVPGPAGKVAV